MNKKKVYIVVVIAAAAALFLWWWSSRQAVETPSDVSDINKELEGLNPNDLDKEFQQIDQDLNTL